MGRPNKNLIPNHSIWIYFERLEGGSDQRRITTRGWRKMKILALDTSAGTATAAISTNGFLTGEISIRNGRTHSQKVIPMIESLLEMVDCKPEDIDLFSVANGPGSFTGLRIGVVTIKAMAYALKKPVCEVSTLMALACTVDEQDGLVCPIMDAETAKYAQVYIESSRFGNVY